MHGLQVLEPVSPSKSLAQVLVFGDCAVNVAPDPEQLAAIASQSAETAAAFGVDPPLVALLSYSTGVSGSGPEVEKVR
jgi:phosphate acetyltransferase